MAQLSLPKNSEVKKGKYYKDKTGSKNLRKINIYRWDPSTEENPELIHTKLIWIIVHLKCWIF